ncbi:MAG: hypothetical protein RMJ44_11420 [Cytophagales bacterium]|nr:hypothetical protein [Bernardetiaceae bacterium]MDW8211685.1 hypothetical protein [Cytophagales bacterium]
MVQVYQSRVWTIFWHENAKCLHFVFQPYSRLMTKEEYLQELKHYIALVQQYCPKAILADTRDFGFTITPDIQDFINKNILLTYESIGVTKHAILTSKDLFAQISIEQTMEENLKPCYQNRYFADEQEAFAWLGL